VFIATTIENDLAVICACVPGMRPLFDKLFLKLGWNDMVSAEGGATATHRSDATWNSERNRGAELSSVTRRATTKKRLLDDVEKTQEGHAVVPGKRSSDDAIHNFYFGHDYEDLMYGDDDSPMSSSTTKRSHGDIR